MSYLYCPSEALDVTTGQCSDPHWVDLPSSGLPPLTTAEGFQIAGAIVGAWAIGYIGRLIRHAMRGHL